MEGLAGGGGGGTPAAPGVGERERVGEGKEVTVGGRRLHKKKNQYVDNTATI